MIQLGKIWLDGIYPPAPNITYFLLMEAVTIVLEWAVLDIFVRAKKINMTGRQIIAATVLMNAMSAVIGIPIWLMLWRG